MLHVLRSEENINHNAKRVLTPSRDFLKKPFERKFCKNPNREKSERLKKSHGCRIMNPLAAYCSTVVTMKET